MDNDKAHSLLNPREEQLPLISSADMDDELFQELEGREQAGEFTGARLFAKDPARYEAIVSLLAEGLGVKLIGKILKVSPNTVMAVRDREPEAVDTLKERVADGARSVMRLCVEGIRECLLDEVRAKKIGPRDLAIIFGIMTEKSELLTGGATARLETGPAEPGHQEFNEWLESLPRVDGQSTRLDGRAREQKEPALLEAEATSTAADPDGAAGPGEPTGPADPDGAAGPGEPTGTEDTDAPAGATQAPRCTDATGRVQTPASPAAAAEDDRGASELDEKAADFAAAATAGDGSGARPAPDRQPADLEGSE